MTKELKKEQKSKATIEFIKEAIEDYERLADEHERLAKQYRKVSAFWRKRYKDQMTRTGPLAPLFVDDVKIITEKKTIFK